MTATATPAQIVRTAVAIKRQRDALVSAIRAHRELASSPCVTQDTKLYSALARVTQDPRDEKWAS